MAFRLPPLNALRLFEAAGRHGSFKRAADELHVTPSAVSHAVQSLEEWLGAPLFSRGARGLALSPAGAAYLPRVSEALVGLAAATDRLPGRKATGAIAVSAAPTFAARWLMPRLSGFTQQHPDIVVTIDTARRQVDLPLEGVDLAIRMGPKARPGGRWVRLMRESFQPVAAPALLKGAADAALGPVLSGAPLIHVTTVGEDWAAWAAAAARAGLEVRGLDLHGGIRVDTVQMALEAAVQGLGIAIGRRPLIDAELECGRLVALAGPAIAGSTCYWLVGADASFMRPEVRLFRTWLLGELGVRPKAPARR